MLTFHHYIRSIGILKMLYFLSVYYKSSFFFFKLLCVLQYQLHLKPHFGGFVCMLWFRLYHLHHCHQIHKTADLQHFTWQDIIGLCDFMALQVTALATSLLCGTTSTASRGHACYLLSLYKFLGKSLQTGQGYKCRFPILYRAFDPHKSSYLCV